MTVRGEDGTVYAEGGDCERIEDPRLGRLHAYGEYSFTHAAPPIRLTTESRLRDGQRLRVGFYHAAVIYGSQVSICMWLRTNPDVPRIDGVFAFRGAEPGRVRAEDMGCRLHR